MPRRRLALGALSLPGRPLSSSSTSARPPAPLPSTYVPGFHDPAVVARMPYRPLGGSCLGLDGAPASVSALSLGGSAFGAVYEETDDDDSVRVVYRALEGGINLIDTAAWYGHGRSEAVLGRALADVPREAYYLNTKCARYDPGVLDMFDFTYDRTMRSIDESLERLGVDYIDAIQVHDPEFADAWSGGQGLLPVIQETLPAMLEAKRQGKVRWVGVTGFPLSILREQVELAQEAGLVIDTCLSYCHSTMLDESLKNELLPFLRERNVACMSASAVGMGLLSNAGPPKWHPASSEIRTACADAAAYCREAGVDISKLALYFALREAAIPTTLVSTTSTDQLRANLDMAYGVAAEEQDSEDGCLSTVEADAMEHVLATFFRPLENASWENVEPAMYKEKLYKAMAGEEVGTLSTN